MGSRLNQLSFSTRCTTCNSCVTGLWACIDVKFKPHTNAVNAPPNRVCWVKFMVSDLRPRSYDDCPIRPRMTFGVKVVPSHSSADKKRASARFHSSSLHA